jgi:undecaprenyl-diphosphatase
MQDMIILGIIQGLTEFIPISSSAHLTIFSLLLNKKVDISLEVLLHFGTLFSIVVYFMNKLKQILSKRLLGLILISVATTGIIGLPARVFIEKVFFIPKLIGLFLMITGLLLYSMTKLKEGRKKISTMGIFDAVFIGFMQVFALLPGISRCGVVLLSCYLRGLSKEDSFLYTLVLMFPTVLGATLFEITKITLSKEVIFSTFISFVSGLIAIKLLFKILIFEKIKYICIYCLLVGLLIWLLFS